MFEVRIQGHFQAEHHVRLPDGQWESPHAHDWRVEARYRRRELDAHDWVVDFVQVKEQLDTLLSTLHGRDLNKLTHPLLKNPTAERVAQWIHDGLTAHEEAGPLLVAVVVEEAPGCHAIYYREPGQS